MTHSEPTATTGAAPRGWPMLGSMISRLKASFGRTPASVALPVVAPGVPLGLAAALTLSMTSIAHALPSHSARNHFQEAEKSLQIVATPQPTLMIETAEWHDAQAVTPGDWVTPEALAAVLAPAHDAPRFMIDGGDGHPDAWSGVFAMATGLSMLDFAASDSAIAQLVD